MNLAKKLKLSVIGHHDLEFIDIDEINDTPLYIDPYVIQALPSEFCEEARRSIDSFFQEVFKACQSRNTVRIKALLRYASEPNETNLGMKVVSNFGKGATSEELSSLFFEFYKIVHKNPQVSSNPLALCMYIQNFGKDKMSDLITNIIRKQLYDFTVRQCKLWNVNLTSEKVTIGYYWDYENLSWKELKNYALSIGGRQFLLVPKEIVRARYVFNIECYIKQYVLKNLQEQHLANNSDMCTTKEYASGRRALFPPSIKELYRKEVHKTVHKEYALQATTQNKTCEEHFVADIYTRIRDGYGALSDEFLDQIVYKKYQLSA